MISGEQWRASIGLYHSGSYRRLACNIGKRRRQLLVTTCRLLRPFLSVLVQTLLVVLTCSPYVILLNSYSIYKRGLAFIAAFRQRSDATQLLVGRVALSVTVMESACANLERSLVAMAILLIMSGDVEENPGPIDEKDIKIISKYLANLSENDLESLGLALGLYLRTLKGYRKGTTAQFRRYLIRDWINGKDNVKSCGGATWSSLVNALKDEEVSQNTIADKIEAEQMGDSPEELAELTEQSTVTAPTAKKARLSPSHMSPQDHAHRHFSFQTGDTPPPQSIMCFTDYLRDFYKTSELPASNKWPPSPSKKYINLAAIEKEEVSSEELEKFTRATLHGNVDDILEIKAPIEIQAMLDTEAGKSLQCVLVEGAPGVGKTTLTWEICNKWGKGELFQQYFAVILLRLRDETVQKAKGIKDLIFSNEESCKDEVAQYLKRTRGKNTLIILEGLDELPKHLLTQSSIFGSLLSGTELPRATILITSRPSATVQLWKDWKHRISRHIEVLGFTGKDINDYIESVMSPSELPDFNDYLTLNPTIKLMMYIPIHAAIVIEVYRYCHKSNRFLPTSVTELYNCLVRTILLRYLDTHPDYKELDIPLKEISDLPSPVYHHFKTLVKMAYNGVLSQQLTFPHQHKQIEHLGFMDTVAECIPHMRSFSYSYNFLHLSVQEYLSAYWISLKTPQEQEHLLQAMCTEQHLRNMGLFLAGITKFKNVDKATVKTIIEKESKKVDTQLKLSPYILQLVNESGDWNIIDGYSSYHCKLTELNPALDFAKLGHCIANNNHKWTLEIGDEGQWMQSIEKIDVFTQTLKNPTCTIGGIYCWYNEPQCVEHLFMGLRIPQNILQQIRVVGLASNYDNSQPLPQCVFELILSMTSRLHKLVLRYGAITTTGAIAIADALQSNNTLTYLDICSNAISKSGAIAFVDMLKSNNTLEVLDLGDNSISGEECKALEEIAATKKNFELLLK